jgi:hypothetical protein
VLFPFLFFTLDVLFLVVDRFGVVDLLAALERFVVLFVDFLCPPFIVLFDLFDVAGVLFVVALLLVVRFGVLFLVVVDRLGVE